MRSAASSGFSLNVIGFRNELSIVSFIACNSPFRRGLLSGSRTLRQLRPQAHAILHVDHVALLGEPIDQRCRQVVVLEKAPPFAEAKIRGDERGAPTVTLVHQSEEKADLNRLDLDVAHLVDQETIVGEVPLDHSVLGVVYDGAVKLANELREEGIASCVAPVDRLDEEARRKPRLPRARRTYPDQVLTLLHEVEGIVEGEDPLFLELRLALEGKGLQDPRLGDLRSFQSLLRGIFPFQLRLLHKDVLEEANGGKPSLLGLRHVLVPMRQDPPETKILQGLQ